MYPLLTAKSRKTGPKSLPNGRGSTDTKHSQGADSWREPVFPWGSGRGIELRGVKNYRRQSYRDKQDRCHRGQVIHTFRCKVRISKNTRWRALVTHQQGRLSGFVHCMVLRFGSVPSTETRGLENRVPLSIHLKERLQALEEAVPS